MDKKQNEWREAILGVLKELHIYFSPDSVTPESALFDIKENLKIESTSKEQKEEEMKQEREVLQGKIEVLQDTIRLALEK